MSNHTSKITDQEIRDLVMERLKVLSSGQKISIGSVGDFSKDQLIDHVLKQDRIGKKIIQIQMSYLQSLKSGVLLDDE